MKLVHELYVPNTTSSCLILLVAVTIVNVDFDFLSCVWVFWWTWKWEIRFKARLFFKKIDLITYLQRALPIETFFANIATKGFLQHRTYILADWKANQFNLIFFTWPECISKCLFNCSTPTNFFSQTCKCIYRHRLIFN